MSMIDAAKAAWEAWHPGVDPEDIPRVAKGVPHRVGRLKCIGNGQVPACAVIAWNELSRRMIYHHEIIDH